MAYGLPLSGDGDEKCLSMLNAVEETISRQLRACKASSSKKRVSEGYCLLIINLKFSFKVSYDHIVILLEVSGGFVEPNENDVWCLCYK